MATLPSYSTSVVSTVPPDRSLLGIRTGCHLVRAYLACMRPAWLLSSATAEETLSHLTGVENQEFSLSLKVERYLHVPVFSELENVMG